MRILLSNDDGFSAPGLRHLLQALRTTHDVTVMAPDRNCSGASNALTLRAPLRVEARAENEFCVMGTPADCVHLALAGFLPELPDLVISGINAGRNLGDDTLYSGTVGAALEGRHLGRASIAVSSVALRPQHYETAVRVTCALVERLAAKPWGAGVTLNVNVPDLPYGQLGGCVATRLGRRGRALPIAPAEDPRGRSIWWIGEVGDSDDGGAGTDFHAIAHGRVSVTPLGVDLTHHAALTELSGWLEAA
ncbi:MAG: 5'/3'-nucleotidase SurE [Nevskiaceae bacterium]|nr:MAG: 5'/3'-nucleotidase SurE [Nevskiaceae bacterium]TBR74716.1 MAG: 5'/3'-nucleotidase SurE [Nevskiaceae bacterium]